MWDCMSWSRVRFQRGRWWSFSKSGNSSTASEPTMRTISATFYGSFLAGDRDLRSSLTNPRLVDPVGGSCRVADGRPTLHNADCSPDDSAVYRHDGVSRDLTMR